MVSVIRIDYRQDNNGLCSTPDSALFFFCLLNLLHSSMQTGGQSSFSMSERPNI